MNDETPPLWVEVFVDKLLVAAFADATLALRCAFYFGSKACIVIDPQLREQWGEDDHTRALREEYPGRQAQAEIELRLRASLADMAVRETASGGLAIWFGAMNFAEVAPIGLRLKSERLELI